MLEVENMSSQMRREMDDDFVFAADNPVKAQANLKVKEMSLSSGQKSSHEARAGSLEGRRQGNNSSVQEASREKLEFTTPEDGKAYNQMWFEKSDSRQSLPGGRGMSRIEDNLLIEEYGYEEEQESGDQMGHEDYEEDDHLEEEYQRAIPASKAQQRNKESHLSIKVESVDKTVKQSLDLQKNDLSFNGLSPSVSEEKIRMQMREDIQQEPPSPHGYSGDDKASDKDLAKGKSKLPQVKIAKRIAKTQDEDFEDEHSANLPPVKVNFTRKKNI